jgi:hypothetical protein
MLETIKTFFRKHHYDLKNPVGYVDCSPLGKWPVYGCAKCGKTLCLDLPKLKDLPWELERGCLGKAPEGIPLPTPENPFPQGI